ncbi:MAG: zinc-dependent alcohol dehydrogenase family protein [Archangium sp.]|nr:zinc-dependent alcohol dehydrogenase family protein [Archangium sp.]
MKALVYHAPGKRSWEEKQKPTLKEPTDAIVRLLATSICGTDLHILKGDVPTVSAGRILGHEGVGLVEEVGPGITQFRNGDRVLISCITSCGRCEACKKGLLSHCVTGGWQLGHLIDGTHAEYVRIPHADNSLYLVPNGVDPDGAVMLSDILPTGFEVGVLKSAIKPGDSVCIVGAGPVGLAALLTAKLFSPSELIVVDVDDHRLGLARKFGANRVVNSHDGRGAEKVLAVMSGKGVDVAIEAVGLPATFELCQDIVAPGGHLANVGVHGQGVPLKLDKLWGKNVTITTGLVDTSSIHQLFKLIGKGLITPRHLITHEYGFDEMPRAWDTFANAGPEKALKVLIKRRM